MIAQRLYGGTAQVTQEASTLLPKGQFGEVVFLLMWVANYRSSCKPFQPHHLTRELFLVSAAPASLVRFGHEYAVPAFKEAELIELLAPFHVAQSLLLQCLF